MNTSGACLGCSHEPKHVACPCGMYFNCNCRCKLKNLDFAPIKWLSIEEMRERYPDPKSKA